ncbi:hypothetical protein [Halosimplex carlsbadense]|nr:hypothetical protein [Halosimplex carlsbadense]
MRAWITALDCASAFRCDPAGRPQTTSGGLLVEGGRISDSEPTMKEDTSANSEERDSGKRLGRRSFLKIGAIVSAVATSGFGMSGVLSGEDAGSGTDTDTRFGYGGTPIATTGTGGDSDVEGTTPAATDSTASTQSSSTATPETVGDTVTPLVSTTATPTAVGAPTETPAPTVTDQGGSGPGGVDGADSSDQSSTETPPLTPTGTPPDTPRDAPVDTGTPVSTDTATSTAAPGGSEAPGATPTPAPSDSDAPSATPTPVPGATATRNLTDEYGEQGYGEYGYGGVPS